jgi:glycosyltransferase involved in cell wall biosynthesis
MSELVRHGENGLLHRHRDADSLAGAIAQALADPARFAGLGRRGYLHSADGDVPNIDDQVASLMRIYDEVATPL